MAARGQLPRHSPLLSVSKRRAGAKAAVPPPGAGVPAAPRGGEGSGGQVCQRGAWKVINEHPALLPAAPPSPRGPLGSQHGHRLLLPVLGAGGPGGTGPR